MDWYKQSTEDVVTTLNTNLDSGLKAAEVETNLAKYGPNELT